MDDGDETFYIVGRAATPSRPARHVPSPNKRDRRARSNHGPRERPECSDSSCEICQALNLAAPPTQKPDEPLRLSDLGLNEHQYPFQKKMHDLDAAIKMLTTKIDEKIYAERYSEAAEIKEVLVNLVDTRKHLRELLALRRSNLGDLTVAQQLKDEYDRLRHRSVDLSAVQKYLTPDETTMLALLRRF